MNIRAFAATLGIAGCMVCAPLATTSFAATPTPGPAEPATPLPTAAPMASPTPTPPPPHGVDCSDGTTGPGWIIGVFPYAAPGSNATVSTSIDVYPDSPSTRSYIAQTIQQQQQQAKKLTVSAAVPSPSPRAVSGTLDSVVHNTAAQQLSTNTNASGQLQSLNSDSSGTTPDAFGNWACHGLNQSRYDLLAKMVVKQPMTDANATPLPLPSNLPSATRSYLQSRAQNFTQVTTSYYTTRINLDPKFLAQKIWNMVVPFKSWNNFATIVQRVNGQ